MTAQPRPVFCVSDCRLSCRGLRDVCNPLPPPRPCRPLPVRPREGHHHLCSYRSQNPGSITQHPSDCPPNPPSPQSLLIASPACCSNAAIGVPPITSSVDLLQPLCGTCYGCNLPVNSVRGGGMAACSSRCPRARNSAWCSGNTCNIIE